MPLLHNDLATAIFSIYIINILFLAGIAQLVEQHIRNVWVGGSNPFSGTIIYYNW